MNRPVGDAAVDVGANIGALSSQASSLVGPSGHAIAIEGHPTTWRALEPAYGSALCEHLLAICDRTLLSRLEGPRLQPAADPS